MKRFILILTIISGIVLVTKAQDSKAKTEFNNTLKAYFDLKNALAADHVNLAGISAKNLLTGIKTFPLKTLTVAQQAAWKKQATELQEFATPIVMEKELKLQRKSFENVASAMIKLVRIVNLNQTDVYVQYCPMVKRSWLNEVEEVQNPFYGSKMYDCGEVTETLVKK